MKKVYFSHYGEAVSMDKNDAIELCKKALEGKGYNTESYPSSKVLKGRTSRREKSYIMLNKKCVVVNHCLDWIPTEWQMLLNDLTAVEVTNEG
jgi:hypothetical protein